MRVQGVGKPARQRLSQGGVKDPRVRGPPDARGRRFPAPSPPPSPSDEGEGADLLPTRKPVEPNL